MSDTNSRKRSCVEREHAPTREEKERRKERQDITSSSSVEDMRDSPYVDLWDNIGEDEEMLLANTEEELYEIIMREGTFKKKVKEVGLEKLKELCWTLHTYGTKSIQHLQMLEKEDEKDANNRANNGRDISLISFQHRRAGWMAKELLGRLGKGERIRSKMKERTKVLEQENALLRKQLEELSKERDELQDKADSRRIGRRDAAVSTEPEVPEVEMEENNTGPSSSIQGIPPNMVGALETIIEKIGELLSRAGLPVEKEREDTDTPITREKASGPNGPGNGVAASKSTRLWSEVAAKGGVGKSQSVRDSIPANKEEGKAGAQAAHVAGKNPKPIRKGGGGTRREREGSGPNPPKQQRSC